ncbi:MAG: hypothetical protein E3J64_09325, partial [Anaerolineales bacterium]
MTSSHVPVTRISRGDPKSTRLNACSGSSAKRYSTQPSKSTATKTLRRLRSGDPTRSCMAGHSTFPQSICQPLQACYNPPSISTTVRRPRQVRRLLCIAAFAAVLLAGCSAPEAGSRVVYGLTLAPSGIDPHVNRSSELGIPLTSVYDTLVYLDPASGGFVAGLAERWQVSSDGLVYTFYLRQDVVFHDGTPFDAEAVRFNLDRIAGDELSSQKARFMLGPYEETEVVDEYEVRILLDEPFAPLLDALSQVYLGMASPTAVTRWGSEYQLHQVGTGPYTFAEYVPGDHLVLRRNTDYAWGPSVFGHQTATVEEIEFRFFVDPATRWAALQTGDADIVGEIPPQHAAQVEQDP